MIETEPGRQNSVNTGVCFVRSFDVCLMHSARLVRSQRGRGRQMNAGAKAATGDVLVFLHADTHLPKGFVSTVHTELHRPGVSAGAFQLHVDERRLSLRLIEWAANLRSNWLQLPYGDQAFFLSKETFRQLGGFAELPILEDVDFARRCRRLDFVSTSSRRWMRLGVARTTCVNAAILIAHFLGFPPDLLARWYYRRQK